MKRQHWWCLNVEESVARLVKLLDTSVIPQLRHQQCYRVLHMRLRLAVQPALRCIGPHDAPTEHWLIASNAVWGEPRLLKLHQHVRGENHSQPIC
eukprot:1829739-Amphidinium_carterae.1